MLKRTFELDNKVRNFWVDRQTGNLFIQDVKEIVEIPHDEAFELIVELKNQLLDFQDSKESLWSKILSVNK